MKIQEESIVSVGCFARMIINLHHITIHILIKNRSTRQTITYYVWVFRVPIRIIPRIRVMYASEAGHTLTPALLYLIFESMETDCIRRRIKTSRSVRCICENYERLLYPSSERTIDFFFFFFICTISCDSNSLAQNLRELTRFFMELL